MSEQVKKDKLLAFYRELCIGLGFCVRSLSIYRPDHPEVKKKVGNFFQQLSKYLEQRPGLTLLFFEGHVTVESTPLPGISGPFAELIQQMEAIKLQRIVFRKGLGSEELIRFFQLLLPLLKKPSGADLVLAKNQERLPHIIAGRLPFELSSEPSRDALSGTLQVARKSVLSLSSQLKELFTDIEGPLSRTKVSTAKEATEKIRGMNLNGKIPLKVLIYRRSNDPDPHIHAINVSALSMAVAKRLGLEEQVILEVGLGALLHDIGLHLKSTAPISKTAAVNLNEKKRRWEHPVRGAEILLATDGIPDLVPMFAYEHHLYFDGDGYPKQKRPRDLHMASMISFITNSYDNLRRNRPEQDALSLTDTLNWMDRRIGTFFHPTLFKQFRAMVKDQA